VHSFYFEVFTFQTNYILIKSTREASFEEVFLRSWKKNFSVKIVICGF